MTRSMPGVTKMTSTTSNPGFPSPVPATDKTLTTILGVLLGILLSVGVVCLVIFLVRRHRKRHRRRSHDIPPAAPRNGAEQCAQNEAVVNDEENLLFAPAPEGDNSGNERAAQVTHADNKAFVEDEERKPATDVVALPDHACDYDEVCIGLQQVDDASLPGHKTEATASDNDVVLKDEAPAETDEAADYEVVSIGRQLPVTQYSRENDRTDHGAHLPEHPEQEEEPGEHVNNTNGFVPTAAEECPRYEVVVAGLQLQSDESMNGKEPLAETSAVFQAQNKKARDINDADPHAADNGDQRRAISVHLQNIQPENVKESASFPSKAGAFSGQHASVIRPEPVCLDDDDSLPSDVDIYTDSYPQEEMNRSESSAEEQKRNVLNQEELFEKSFQRRASDHDLPSGIFSAPCQAKESEIELSEYSFSMDEGGNQDEAHSISSVSGKFSISFMEHRKVYSYDPKNNAEDSLSTDESAQNDDSILVSEMENPEQTETELNYWNRSPRYVQQEHSWDMELDLNFRPPPVGAQQEHYSGYSETEFYRTPANADQQEGSLDLDTVSRRPSPEGSDSETEVKAIWTAGDESEGSPEIATELNMSSPEVQVHEWQDKSVNAFSAADVLGEHADMGFDLKWNSQPTVQQDGSAISLETHPSLIAPDGDPHEGREIENAHPAAAVQREINNDSGIESNRYPTAEIHQENPGESQTVLNSCPTAEVQQEGLEEQQTVLKRCPTAEVQQEGLEEQQTVLNSCPTAEVQQEGSEES